MTLMNRRHACLAACIALAALAAGAEEVYTRAVVKSVATESGRLYIRLKLVPRAKIPFSIHTYRVSDAKLVAGLREGDSVRFRAERQGGENVLTAIETAPPCERFSKCE
jgi:Cu/Ag efflux protein CusF